MTNPPPQDQHTEIRTISWLQRLINSIAVIFLGILFFIGGCWLLFYNEGRLDYSQLAQEAITISPQKFDSNAIDKLITVTGNLYTEKMLGDDLYLKPDLYIGVERTVKMFAWIETEKKETKINVGGSETVETTYTYTQEWEEDPPDSSQFNVTSGHYNPSKQIDNLEKITNQVSLGIYQLNLEDLIFKLRYKKLNLTENNIILNYDIQLINNFLFTGNGTYQNPEIGDLRISYGIIPNNLRVTIFGKLEDDGNKIVPYFTPKKKRFYRVIEGSYGDAVKLLGDEFIFRLWGFRFVGFCLIWLGLNAIFEPINIIFDIIPTAGVLSRFIIRTITFIFSIIISVGIIFGSAFLHHGLIPVISSSISFLIFTKIKKVNIVSN